MAAHKSLNNDETKAIAELRGRLKNALSSEMYEDTLLFYRFLKARDFDVDKAEAMLKKHLIWRKAFQLDNYLDIFKPFEVHEKSVSPSVIGFDKNGDIVRYMPLGKLETRDMLKCIKMNDFEKSIISVMVKTAHMLKEENKKRERSSYQASVILDLDKLTFSNVANPTTAEGFLRIMLLLQDNYPEFLKSIFIINAPAYYIIVFAILKRMLSHAMMQKMQVFSRSGWKEALLEKIEADVLPAFLGGNRTDPDGNPLCLTFMCHSYDFSSKYYLSYEDRWFKDESLVKKISVPPRQKSRVFVEVKKCGSFIQWEFKVKGKDIGFGVILEEDGLESEILPVIKYTTSDGTEKFHYKCHTAGKYIIVFDNTYSRMTSKEVSYCVTVSVRET